MAESTEQKRKVNLRFLYVHVNDLKAVRRFYTDTLGLQQGVCYDKDDMGYVGYQLEGLELQFWRWDRGQLPINEKWDWQPGVFDGEGAKVSWSIQIPEENFPGVVKRIQHGKYRTMTEKPIWLDQTKYWAFTAKDPAGNTVEVYSVPRVEPTITEWNE